MVTKTKKSTLPKWLIAEDVECTREFMVHTEFPRFIGEIFDDEETGGSIIGFPKGDIEFIDNVNIDDKSPAKLAKLMREAGDALAMYDDINEQKADEARRLELEDEI